MFLQCLNTWSFLLFSLRRMSLLKTDGKLVIVVAKCGDVVVRWREQKF